MKKPASMPVLLGVTAMALAISGFALASSPKHDAAPPIEQSFTAFWQAAQDKPFAEQEALWDQFIEQPREAVYQSVVWEVRNNPDWKQGKDRSLKSRFEEYRRMGGDIPGGVHAIDAALGVQAKRFAQYFGASGQPRAIVVLAPDFDAKSGVMPNGDPVLALAVDSLLLEKAQLDIVLPHELFHLWDAEHSGITNDGVMPDTHLLLPLFEEGLATYVSTVVSPGHTDGEYLLQNDLGALPEARLNEAARRFLREADVLTIDPARHRTSDTYVHWFEGNSTPFQHDLPNRSGYWLGLHAIRVLARRHSLSEMASWSPARAEKEIRAALLMLADGGQVSGH
ncbi:hypothetical protein [Dyella japonica]|uniref:DUF2268 domain-containing protein n=1 Tax=Dyella japonica A8 TaxID=1217721 RepID=A0A075K549_9GAMM|nr:hypothetical protein [Dyella japonica]AIF48817.1 hypothetical protein HY57_16990 [Dyella japonica A8]